MKRSRNMLTAPRGSGTARRTAQQLSVKVVSTDPPYYDNIGYADLSDFFYVWLRRSLRQSFPIYSLRSRCPRPRSWSLHPIVTAARRKRKHSFSME